MAGPGGGGAMMEDPGAGGMEVKDPKSASPALTSASPVPLVSRVLPEGVGIPGVGIPGVGIPAREACDSTVEVGGAWKPENSTCLSLVVEA